MSVFFGIFNRNGNLVDKRIANNMLKSMSSWDPDESNLWVDGPVALGHGMLWNTIESKFEHLPLEKDVYLLTMDARIDNRDELATEVELPNSPINEIGDSEFILAAYRRWGEECPKYLLGDFSFAIWDGKRKQIFCARDHIGIKLFHFYISDHLFSFSNDIECLLTHKGISKELDDNTVASFLKDEGIHTERDTFFKQIKKLPPATSLTITSSQIYEKKYWIIENSPSIKYASFDDYVRKLRELFDNAVEARLRTSFPVASHLSGGIDSSPIAVLAARKLKKKNKHLYAYNWINIPNDCNEYEFEAWNFSRRIAAQETNIVHQEFNIDPQYIADQYEHHNVFTKGNMQYWKEYYVQNMVEKVNARTLLSGWGGDELITFNGYTYIEGLFSQGKIIQAFKCLFDEKKYYNYTWKRFAKRTIRQIFPYKRNLNFQGDYYRFLTSEFEIFMREHTNPERRHESGVRKMQLLQYHKGHIQNRIESWALCGFSKKIEYCYPLLDKRIVEFAIGIPEELFYPQRGKERPLIKNVVQDLLPSDIIWFNKPNEVKVNASSRKAHFKSFQILKEIYAGRDCELYKNKYVDCKKIKEILETFDFENADTNTWELGNIIPSLILLSTLKRENMEI